MKKIIAVLIGLIWGSWLARPAIAAETSFFVHSDHLGSTSLITDGQGAVVQRQAYYPYGVTRQKLKAEGLEPTAREYTGQVNDQDQTGLYYYNARYYDPAIGKFTQADSSEGPNRYQYTGNNPIRFIDPNGEADSAFDGGGGKSDSQSGSGSRFVVNLAQTFTDMSDFNTWKASSPEGRAQLALEAAAPAAVLGTELGILVTPSIIAGYETLLWKATQWLVRTTNGLPARASQAEQVKAEVSQMTQKLLPGPPQRLLLESGDDTIPYLRKALGLDTYKTVYGSNGMVDGELTKQAIMQDFADSGVGVFFSNPNNLLKPNVPFALIREEIGIAEYQWSAVFNASYEGVYWRTAQEANIMMSLLSPPAYSDVAKIIQTAVFTVNHDLPPHFINEWLMYYQYIDDQLIQIW